MTIFKHSHDPTSTETAESSNVSSRRESVVSTDSSATVHPGGTDGNVNGNDGVPPGEVIQAEIAAARAIPSSLLTSLGAWWNSSEQTARDSETRLLKRIPFFRTPHEPDVQPTPENPNPITARVTQVPLKDNARSSKGGRMINMCSFLTPETKGGKEAVVLTHGYGAGLAFFYRNLQEMAETSGESTVVSSRLFSGKNTSSCCVSYS
jgi:cardiolipin-specific phospholipase